MTESLHVSGHLAVLAELDALLRHHEVAYWIFGGWAVDFHAGRVTREHGDIDIAIWSHDRVRLDALLRDRLWAHRPDIGEDGYTCYERNGIRLEITFLARDDRGHVYTPLVSGGRGEWPSHSFGDEVAQLCGVHARVVGRDSLIADKSIARSDSITAAKDRADIVTLLHRDSSPEPPANASFRLDPETRVRVAPQFDVDALETLLGHLAPASRPGMLDGFLLPEFWSNPPRPNEFWVLQGFGNAVLDELLAEVWQPFWDAQPDEMLEDPHSPYPGRNLARRRRGFLSL